MTTNSQKQYEETVKLIKNEVKKQLEKADVLFGKYYKSSYKPVEELKVTFFEKGSCAGKQLTYKSPLGYRYELTFNIKLAQENIDLFINDTIPHEVAHYIKCRITREGQSHDNTWKNIMRRLGYEPKQYHNMDMSQVNDNYVRYDCTCGQPFCMTKLKAKRISMCKSDYICTKCKSKLDKDKIRRLVYG